MMPVPISPPPRDASGNVIPHDHEQILQKDPLIRRVSGQVIVDDPKSPSGKRVSTMLFSKPTTGNGGISVDLKRQLEEDGKDPVLHVTTPRWIGSVLLSASAFRDENLQVGYSPLPDNDYHAEAWGMITKPGKKRLLQASAWFVKVPNVHLG